MVKVLFVCLGNICRSPLAEGIFNQFLDTKNLNKNIICDSAGTSDYHAGELPHNDSMRVASENGITLTHRSRPFVKEDFERFGYIIGMDSSNISNIKKIGMESFIPSKLLLMRAFDNQKSNRDVDDPWGYSFRKFEECYKILHECCDNFLNYLVKEHN